MSTQCQLCASPTQVENEQLLQEVPLSLAQVLFPAAGFGMVEGMVEGMVKGICAHRSEGKTGSQISPSSFYNMQMHLLTGIVYLSICTTLIRLHYLKLLLSPQEIIKVSAFAQMFCRVFSLTE